LLIETIKKNKAMNYTQSQIENAKANYNAFLKIETIHDYNVEVIGYNQAEQRMDFHNKIVNSILAGNKEIEREWKQFFLNEQVKSDKKSAEIKAKLDANKDASSDILATIKAAKKIGEFGKWLNQRGNPFRNQHFSKKYTTEAVNAFLSNN
jgi:ATP-dependent Lon protease